MRVLGMTLMLGGLIACDGKDEVTGDDTGGGDTGEMEVPIIDADGDGYSAEEDCDDTTTSINPGAVEVCDDIDNNCDGNIDEGVLGTFYEDDDADGYGSEEDVVEACDQPSDYLTVAGDCNDSDATISPDGTEVCDGADNNCDGTVDEGVTSTFYADADGDGYGTDAKIVEACEAGKGYAETADDCDDAVATTYPGAGELCNGIDADCDPKTNGEDSVYWTDGAATVDLTADFTKGTAGTPAQILLADAGDVTFCGGIWYADVDITADVNLYGEGGSGENVLSGGGSTSVLAWPSDGTTSIVDGLTVTAGGGFYDSSFALIVGGAIRCPSVSTVSMNDVIVSNSYADVGGGLFVWGCTIDFTESIFTGNDAQYGGGIFVYSGEVNLTDSEVSGNTASATAGGIMAQGSGGYASVDLIDTAVTANEGAYAGGLATVYAADMTCSSTKGGKNRGSVTNNISTTGTYAGGLFTQFTVDYTSYTFTSDDCDFGDDKAGDNNGPNDVYSYDQFEEYTDYGVGASFTCNYDGCY